MLDLRAAIAHDYLVFDGRETVTYRSVRDNGTMVDWVVDAALRRARRQREQAPSYGVYQAAALRWHIPRVVLDPMLSTEGQVPKQRDVIVDGAGIHWTVQAVETTVLQTMYAFDTLNLAVAYDLRHTIDIERAGVTYDAAGVARESFPPESGGSVLYAGLACRVQAVEEAIAEGRLIRGEQVDYLIYLERQIVVDVAEDRVKWTVGNTTRYLDIVSLKSPERIDELPVLECKLKVA